MPELEIAAPDTLTAFLGSDASLVASDYDGTQVRTFEPSPEGIGVNEAYEIAIKEVLGNIALHEYVAMGGHHNRTPTEIVASLVPTTPGELLDNIKEKRTRGEPMADILDYIHGYHHDHQEGLFQPYLPASIWQDKPMVEAVTSVMTEAKLRVLTAQVGLRMPDGSMWPRPTAGFLEYSAAIDEAKAEGRPITTAVVSAGHAAFILRTYEVHGITPPDIMLTDETIQHVNPMISLDRRSKPAPFPMALLKTLWLREQGISPNTLRSPTYKPVIDQKITYIGDDEVKDGGLARSGNVAFVPLDNPDDPRPWALMAKSVGIDLEFERGE